MEIRNTTVESFIKSPTFSLLLCLLWGAVTLIRARALLEGFDFIELLWVFYNATISLLFLIRVRPSVVSMNPIHWMVALITSFSGFLFSREGTNSIPALLFAAEALILSALLLGIATALILGRSYDFLPALRHVRTECVYQFVRHPMYLSSIIMQTGYVLKNASKYNALLLAVIILLYDRRARYEEDVMGRNKSYIDYMRQVKYRFIPGIY